MPNWRSVSWLVGAALVGSLGCSGAQVRGFKRDRVCLVLSIGAADGLAHLGAIAALQEAKFHPQCVYGNSMGAVVGALYADAPSADPVERYRRLIALYAALAHTEWEEKTLLEKAWCFLTDTTPKAMNIKRFAQALEKILHAKNIQDTAITFVTAHQQVTQTGVTHQNMRHGPLAELVAASANNLLIFGDPIEQGAKIDPGSDRLAKVPVVDACEAFPDAHLLVVNVTGEPAFTNGVTCPFTEIRIAPRVWQKAEFEEAFAGKGVVFDEVVAKGRAAMAKGVRY